jgi:hypothetical protein
MTRLQSMVDEGAGRKSELGLLRDPSSYDFSRARWMSNSVVTENVSRVETLPDSISGQDRIDTYTGSRSVQSSAPLTASNSVPTSLE